MTNTIRIVVADDHSVVRDGLAAIISSQPDMRVVGEAEDGFGAVDRVMELQPDVLLLDLVLPRKDGLMVIQELGQSDTSVRILVLTSFADDDKVFKAIKAGASGYLLKDTRRDQLLQAIRDVAEGNAVLHPAIALKVMRELEQPPEGPVTTQPLTMRELETLRLVAQGLTNQEIAAELVLHERTVAKYVSSILSKLHLANRTQAALYALRKGLAELE